MRMVKGDNFKVLAEQPEKHRAKAEQALEKIKRLHSVVMNSTAHADDVTGVMVQRLVDDQKKPPSDPDAPTVGILHGDLNKLDNIMWDEEAQEPFLIDFGLSKRMEDAVAADMAKHSRALQLRDANKKLGFWYGYDTNHLKAKFKL
eukprot:TRINITY_DN17032_c0_g1_i1.p1 TRINITY_DN17032_c0_g1~~TRINITY_DN17032_c0_g1_i1.p1  ORF type:complete len:146 (-),score=45.04 TRINITY_DN17032_c0_g1_i1:90-527(-)